MNTIALWIAQGFGVGRIPVAPGTFGSIAGIAWMALLVAGGNIWVYIAGNVIGIALSIWLCGVSEKILKQTDPGCVVLDEIIAMPICFFPWVITEWSRHNAWPSASVFFQGKAWLGTLALFGLFRLFDIWKPWPIHQSQQLPGGWGITIDDVLAGLVVALISFIYIHYAL